MTFALIVFAVVVGLGAIILALLFGVLLFVDYERGMRMLGGLAMFVRSVRKKPEPDRPRRHQREGDETPREHRRKTPASPGTIRMFAQPAPPRRRSGDNPKSSEPEE